jgi:transposase-like protein
MKHIESEHHPKACLRNHCPEWTTHASDCGTLRTRVSINSRVHSSPDFQVHPQERYEKGRGVGKAAAELEKDDIQRWTTKRKAALVLSVIKGETSVQQAARQHGITVAELEDWKERFLLAAVNAPRARPKDEEALREEQIKKLKQKIGDLVMDIDILKEAAKRHPPMPGTSEP